MRLKISLASKKGNYLIPFNYNHILSAIIYRKIADLDLAAKLHFSKDFKFFTFSQIYVPNWKRTDRGIISRDGKLEFYISSPNDNLIKSLVEGHLENSEVIFKGDKLLVEQIELLKKPDFSKTTGSIKMKTMSPVIARIKREVNGKLRIWDLEPGDERFYEGIQKNLINKYTAFYGDYDGDRWVKIRPDMNSARRRRIDIKGNFHRCFMMNFEMEADARLIEFTYDCGLGEKNSMGFGMVEIIDELTRIKK
ncbi:CRISPR-associated endoribonuclease Cas6 [Methanobacterium petrolearium]|uniref:CRISPR-associated endoribonuclease Cas6 n=1 Tax=Methanobacterium petrolearium TaxID=710190 RepID=UPI001AE8F262|nr:CRISPR-associated endoribonuclease Cas6 [Methanobacterium petrolearium]MBP1946364.1 CRISPR-associated endoribonuclease Cas6 [Methanobacterium petrolearium]BDZ70616.1 CRISPR-associated endoribonuclease Cas6 [Methanobacterium petrolearium]